MLTSLIVTCIALGIMSCIWLIFWKQSYNNQKQIEPPGPWGLPILGHIPFLGKNSAATFMRWARIYGPIISVKFGRVPAVVLNDAKIIKEAFNLESLSGRPHFANFIQATQMKGLSFGEGPRQTEQRRFAIRAFKGNAFSKTELEFKALDEISKFLKALRNQCKTSFDSQKPQKLIIHHFFEYPVINSLWVSIMGHRFSENDPRLRNIKQIVDKVLRKGGSVIAQMSMFSSWVSKTLTFLGINHVESGLISTYSLMEEQIEESKRNYVTGQPKNFTHAYLDHVAETKNTESSFFEGREQSFATSDIFLAAVDTTTVSLDWLFLYMAREPLIQQKLQAEIDAVIGFEVDENDRPRTATIVDRIKMPYTEAVIKELLRITSVTPLAFFHRAFDDINFHGYRIPKDTLIVANLYGIHHDSEIWSEPHSFQPQRFLTDDANIVNGNNPKSAGVTLPFSFGRRSCIGEAFARDQLFLMTTHFFQHFSLSCTDKIPKLDADFGIVTSPLPFEVLVSERNVENN